MIIRPSLLSVHPRRYGWRRMKTDSWATREGYPVLFFVGKSNNKVSDNQAFIELLKMN